MLGALLGALCWDRGVLEDGSGTASADRGAPWASLWCGPRRLVFGHDAIRGAHRARIANIHTHRGHRLVQGTQSPAPASGEW